MAPAPVVIARTTLQRIGTTPDIQPILPHVCPVVIGRT
jgi:hypothetical protein